MSAGSTRSRARLAPPPPGPLEDSGSAIELGPVKSAPALPVYSRSYTDLDRYAQNPLLRPTDWMSVQQMTFTNWMNDRLRNPKGNSSGPQVTDLRVDLSDGLLLIRLLENLTGKKIKGFERHPEKTAHKMVNLDLAFEHMRSEGIKLIGIGSMNVFQGDRKLILGLVWTLIQKYQIRMLSTKVSTKAVMIRWLQALLPEWNITNLTNNWNDGRCLLALINEVKPGVGPDVSTLDPTKRRNNCTLAIRIARNHLKIPQIVAPEDLANPAIDELSMMTYLSYFCEPARSRLLKWVKKKIPQMRITNFSTDWEDARAFAALMETCFPGTLPNLSKLEKGNGDENARQVFEVGKKRLGIEPNFTVKELTKAEAEELKIMTYLLHIKKGELKPLPDEILLSGPGLLKATAGKQTQFEIDTTRAGPGRLFIDAYSENGLKVKFSLQERLPGILTLTYTPEVSGTINFDILWSDIPIPKSPFSVRVTDSMLVRIIDFERHERLVQVNVPVELRLNTKSSGQGSLTAHLQYEHEPLVTAKVTTFRDGTAKLQYTPPKAGKPVLQVFWNGELLQHLSISYIVVDNHKYRVVAKPEKRLYHTFDRAEFKVQAEGLPLEVLQMTAIFGDIQIPITFKSIEGNTGNASFTPTLPGKYRIEVACIEKLVEGCPFEVEVSDPSRCRLQGVIPKYLQHNTPFEFFVETKDAGVGTLQFECADRNTEAIFRTEVRPDRPVRGTQMIMVTPHKCGEFLVGIKFHNTHIPSSPFRITVCDPSECSVSGDLVEKRAGIVGKPIRFKILVPNPSDGIKPMVKALGPSAKYSAEIRTTNDRVYIVQFTPWEIGTHEVSITYGDFHIPNSPFLVAVTGFDSNICSATGSGLQEALTGIPSQFVVLAKQSGLLEDGTLQISVQGVINKVECKVRVRDNKNGTYNVAYLTQIPGAYLVSILAGQQHIPGSPFRLTALPGPLAHKCSMFGPALEPNAILTIGKPIDFSVDTSEAGTGQLSVKAVGPGGAQARVYIAKADKSGIYDIKLDPVRHGKYRVSARWSGRLIPGSPFLLKIFPGADASKCKAYGPGLEDGFVGKVSEFVIETRDAGAGTLKVRLHGIKDAFKIEIKPISSQDVRTLEARYDPRKPGEYLVTIKWSDMNVPGSPFKVKITGDAIDIDPQGRKATPRNPLEVIDEIDEDEEEEGQSEQKPKDKKRKRRKRRGLMPIPIIPIPVAVHPSYLDPRSMPVFNPRMVPYHYAFLPPPPNARKAKSSKTVHASSPTKKSDSTSSLDSQKMVTFSNLQQVKKHARSNSSGPISGDYHGQASMHIETVTRRSVKRSISDTSTTTKKTRKY